MKHLSLTRAHEIKQNPCALSFRGQKIYLLTRRYPSGSERLVMIWKKNWQSPNKTIRYNSPALVKQRTKLFTRPLLSAPAPISQCLSFHFTNNLRFYYQNFTPSLRVSLKVSWVFFFSGKFPLKFMAEDFPSSPPHIFAASRPLPHPAPCCLCVQISVIFKTENLCV